MAYFLLRLEPPRPSFPFDATEAEKALFSAHSGYWMEQAEAGAAIAVGPVFEPGGTCFFNSLDRASMPRFSANVEMYPQGASLLTESTISLCGNCLYNCLSSELHCEDGNTIKYNSDLHSGPVVFDE